mmetsp:Transcript_94255/g.224393  ORF Transcript_94255/g.224393 Transcript_94255/m.224393 type:complete len:384 (-) Transcript_94255:975-2126(-)
MAACSAFAAAALSFKRFSPVSVHHRSSSLQSAQATSTDSDASRATALSNAASRVHAVPPKAFARDTKDGRTVRESCCRAIGGSASLPCLDESTFTGASTRNASGTYGPTGASSSKASSKASKKLPACSEQLPRRRSSAAVAEAQHVAAPRLARSPAELCPRPLSSCPKVSRKFCSRADTSSSGQDSTKDSKACSARTSAACEFTRSGSAPDAQRHTAGIVLRQKLQLASAACGSTPGTNAMQLDKTLQELSATDSSTRRWTALACCSGKWRQSTRMKRREASARLRTMSTAGKVPPSKSVERPSTSSGRVSGNPRAFASCPDAQLKSPGPSSASAKAPNTSKWPLPCCLKMVAARCSNLQLSSSAPACCSGCASLAFARLTAV